MQMILVPPEPGRETELRMLLGHDRSAGSGYKLEATISSMEPGHPCFFAIDELLETARHDYYR